MQPEYALLCAVCGLCSPPHHHHCMSCCSADSQGTASSQALLPKPHKAPSTRTLIPVKLTVSVCVFPGSFFMSAFPAKKQVVGIEFLALNIIHMCSTSESYAHINLGYLVSQFGSKMSHIGSCLNTWSSGGHGSLGWVTAVGYKAILALVLSQGLCICVHAM